MDEQIARFIENLIDRFHGPLTFRLILQPLTAILLALQDGRKDAREGNPPYLWSLLRQPAHRKGLMRQAWQTTGRVFLVAIIVDLIYQLLMFHWFYPLEALTVASCLALIPYLLMRGPFGRIFRKTHK